MGCTRPAPTLAAWRPGRHSDRARGPLRTGGDGPAGLAHRPLQPALLLLHACRGPRLAARRGGAHRRRSGPADPGRRRAARHPRGPVHRRRAAGPPRDRRHRRADHAHRPRRRDLDDHQRARAGGSPARWPRPGSTGSTSASTRSARRRSRRSPAATGSPTWSRGSAAAGGGGARAGEGQRRAAAGRQRRPGRRAAALVPRPGCELRFIEQMPLDAQHGWSREGMITADEIFERLEREFVLRPAEEPRGSAPAEKFWSTGTGDGGHDRLGHPAVLRRLRPGPADRRRSGAQLPVRPPGVRPAGRAADRSERRGARRAVAGRDARQGAPATASTTRRSSSPIGRCRRSAADSPRSSVRHDVLEEAAARQEVRQRLAVLVAGQPDLAPVRACAAWGCSSAAATTRGGLAALRPSRGRRIGPHQDRCSSTGGFRCAGAARAVRRRRAARSRRTCSRRRWPSRPRRTAAAARPRSGSATMITPWPTITAADEADVRIPIEMM